MRQVRYESEWVGINQSEIDEEPVLLLHNRCYYHCHSKNGELLLKRIALPILLIVALAGCGLTPLRPAVDMQNRFVGSEHEQYKGQGSGVLKGQGFLRQKGGAIITCAGSKVLMFPATPFFQEFVNHLRAGRRVAALEKIDGNYQSILKQTQCDAQGNFSFDTLPSGAWYVVTEVKWTVGYSQQGGTLLRQVFAVDGRSEQLLLSDDDFAGR